MNDARRVGERSPQPRVVKMRIRLGWAEAGIGLRLALDSARVGLQPRPRVDDAAVDVHLEVEVVGGRAAGAADQPNELTCLGRTGPTSTWRLP